MVSSQTLRTSQPRNKSSKRLIVICIVFLAVVLGLVLWLGRNTSLYSVDPTNAKAKMTSLLDKIQPASGKLLYSGVVDQGCDNESSVGLAERESCTLAGYKYYQSQTDVKQPLKAIDATLTQNSWEPLGASATRRTDVLKGVTGSVTYGSTTISKASLRLDLYDAAKQQTATAVQELIEAKKIKIPENKGSIFGIRVSQTYWSCREDSLFQLPCPTPPSELEK